MRTIWSFVILLVALSPAAWAVEPPAEPQLARDVLPLVKAHCVKCHGPAKAEGGLNLSTPGFVARGSENGAVVVAGNAADSLLWHRVEADEMPPDKPLPANEKALLKRWIDLGARGLPKPPQGDPAADHWSFRPLIPPVIAPLPADSPARTDIDRLVLAPLAAAGLSFNPEADRPTLIRRVSFDLCGLPPTPEEVDAFVRDSAPDAYERMVDWYLASPHYGERWGKFWLDAAGYADSNGYFNADTDRPLAYRYRDYVVRAFNADKPFDRFVVEQLAGDELAGFVAGQQATPETIELLEATHFLRNGQDGSGESDGNEDEVKIDRYSALEACQQIVASSLLGLTMQCAKCHDHKFEPVSQREYYQLQSVFYPAFNINNWKKPNERTTLAPLPGEREAWEKQNHKVDRAIAKLQAQFADWVREHRLPSTVLFEDSFAADGPPLADRWSASAPGDDQPGGSPAVQLDSQMAPGAKLIDGALQIIESGGTGDRLLSTRQSFDWTPNTPGEWIQVTFDLVDDKLPGGAVAERIAYFLATKDFNDRTEARGGNILIDGNPAGGAGVHIDYPGADDQPRGTLGKSKYEPGHNYGVRITHQADGKFSLEQLRDGIPDDGPMTLEAADLPDGGFGFEFCCGRSFVVDNVSVARNSADSGGDAPAEQLKQLREQQKKLAGAIKTQEKRRGEEPGRIAWMTDRAAEAPEVFLLVRGDHRTPGEKVEPAPLGVLNDTPASLPIAPPANSMPSTGRRLAWANWLTAPGSRPAALLARVQANRVWQHHFGSGLVLTGENLGISGSPPSHPELLDYLALQLERGGWRMKDLHRQIMRSAVYRQSSALNAAAHRLDPDNRLLWRKSLVRLDAESLRDAMLAISGQLDVTLGGAYVPTSRNELGEVVTAADSPGARRRSLYMQQRRTQTLSLLGVFDSPTMVFNCLERPVSTIPLQSLSLLNSEFAREQATRFAARLASEAGPDAEARLNRAFQLATARAPSEAERQASLEFLASQRAEAAAAEGVDTDARIWTDFCQMILASSAFLYLE